MMWEARSLSRRSASPSQVSRSCPRPRSSHLKRQIGRQKHLPEEAVAEWGPNRADWAAMEEQDLEREDEHPAKKPRPLSTEQGGQEAGPQDDSGTCRPSE